MIEVSPFKNWIMFTLENGWRISIGKGQYTKKHIEIYRGFLNRNKYCIDTRFFGIIIIKG